MDHDLVLCVSLSPDEESGRSGATRPPVVVQNDGDSDDALPSDAVVVRRGGIGWMAIDRATDEVKPLHEESWSPLAGWRLKLASRANEPEFSICDHSGVLAQELQVRPGPSSQARPERILLPAEEGATRIIGRGETTDHVIADKKVSREQLRITIRDGRTVIEDLKSAWGTRLNGKRISSPTELEDGDEITVGDTVLAFVDPLASPFGQRRENGRRGSDDSGRRAGGRPKKRPLRLPRLPRLPRVPRPSLEMVAAVGMLVTVFGVLIWVVASLVAHVTEAPATPGSSGDSGAQHAHHEPVLETTEEVPK